MKSNWTNTFAVKMKSSGFVCTLGFRSPFFKKGERKKNCRFFFCYAKCTKTMCTRTRDASNPNVRVRRVRVRVQFGFVFRVRLRVRVRFQSSGSGSGSCFKVRARVRVRFQSSGSGSGSLSELEFEFLVLSSIQLARQTDLFLSKQPLSQL